MMKIVTQRDINDISEKQLYLRRWSLWLPFGWSIKLHKIVLPDHDRCQHDHPWWFIRIILWGGYVEDRGSKKVIIKPWRPWAPWRIYPVFGNFRHRIDHLLNGPSWSLILCGPKNREWGFFTKEGWMHWKKFIQEAKTARIMWCSDGRELKNDDQRNLETD